jgi:hypothetical protein
MARSIVVMPLLSQIVRLDPCSSKSFTKAKLPNRTAQYDGVRPVYLHVLKLSSETEDDVLMLITLECLSKPLLSQNN